MREILRSVMVGPSDNPAQVFRNYQRLYESGFEFLDPKHDRLWMYVKDFCSQHHHCPDLQTVRLYFTSTREVEVTDQLTILETMTPVFEGNFATKLEVEIDDRRKAEFAKALQDSGTILTSGLQIGKGKDQRVARGVFDAMAYVREKMSTIALAGTGSQLYGEVLGDTDQMRQRYDQRAKDTRRKGVPSGIMQMDDVMRGIKAHELWIHAGFTGHLKTSLALTWAYNAAIYAAKNILIFSLEMDYERLSDLLLCMHSTKDNFRARRLELGIQPDPLLDVGIDYKKVRETELSQIEYDFLFGEVAEDLSNNAEYGKIIVEVADPDKIDFTVLDIKARAEIHHQTTTIDMIIVDHMGLVSSRNKYSNTTEKLNEVIRDLKKLTDSFDHGKGIAILSLMQINREGYKQILKLKGQYDLTALSYANEAERSADIVTASFISTEMRKLGFVNIQCLKNREGSMFDPIYARVDWNAKQLFSHDTEVFISDFTPVAEDPEKQYRGREQTPKAKPVNPKGMSKELGDLL